MASLVGILSDSHGEATRTRRAIELLQADGASVFIHCGDLGTEEVLDAFAGLQVHAVAGNCDDAGPLIRYGHHLGLDMQHPLGTVEVDGKRLAFTHGDDGALLQQAIDAKPDFLFHGHSHLKRDETLQGVRVINPGALHRALRFTVALLNPTTGDVKWLSVP